MWQPISEPVGPENGTPPRRLRTVLDLVATLPAQDPPPFLTVTLCHGDFHPENLLWEGMDVWIWADLQAVRIGKGPGDLAFFWQRAEMAGGTVPRDAMIRAYRSGLSLEGTDTPTALQLDQALAWAELTFWLLDWPPFLDGVSSGRLGSVLDRTDDLTERLGTGRGN